MAILTSDKNPKSSCVGKAIASLLLVCMLLLCSCASPQNTEPPAFPTDAVVSYLGPAGTYTEQAAERLFPQGAVFEPKQTVADAVSSSMPQALQYSPLPSAVMVI